MGIEVKMLYQIKAPYFTAGLFFGYSKGDDLFVMEAAPIIKYMKGWNLNRLENYCKRKGWDCNEVELTKEKAKG